MGLLSFSFFLECPFLLDVRGYPSSSGKFIDFIILLVFIFSFFQREVGGHIEGGTIAIKTLWGDRD